MKKREYIFFALTLGIVIVLVSFRYYPKAHLPLKYACLFDAVWAGDIQEVNYYIANNVSLNKNEQPIPPLNAAVYLKHFEIAKLLLQKGANVHEMEDESGWTALHEAAAKNRIDFAQLLLQHGADVNAEAHAARGPGNSWYYKPSSDKEK